MRVYKRPFFKLISSGVVRLISAITKIQFVDADYYIEVDDNGHFALVNAKSGKYIKIDGKVGVKGYYDGNVVFSLDSGPVLTLWRDGVIRSGKEWRFNNADNNDYSLIKHDSIGDQTYPFKLGHLGQLLSNVTVYTDSGANFDPGDMTKKFTGFSGNQTVVLTPLESATYHGAIICIKTGTLNGHDLVVTSGGTFEPGSPLSTDDKSYLLQWDNTNGTWHLLASV